MENESTFQELQRKVEDLEREIHHIKTYGAQLTVDLDSRSEDSYNREFTPSFTNQLQEEIFNSVWDNHFYYYTPFEAIEGWYVALGGATVDNRGLYLYADAAGADQAAAGKELPFDGALTALSFDVTARFRTMLAFVSTTDPTGVEYVLGVGMSLGTISQQAGKHYGFRVIGNNIYGSVADGTNRSEILIGTFNYGGTNPRNIEARFFPKDRVDFYISDTSDREMKLVGTLKKNIPSGDMTNWLGYWLKSTAGEQTTYVNSVEYIQKKLEE